MKSIYKSTIFIIGIAMLSIVVRRVRQQRRRGRSGICTCSSYQERQL